MYSSMMKLRIRSARVHVEMDFYHEGSVLRGTVKSGCSETRTIFELESDEPEDRLLLLIRNDPSGINHLEPLPVPVGYLGETVSSEAGSAANQSLTGSSQPIEQG